MIVLTPVISLAPTEGRLLYFNMMRILSPATAPKSDWYLVDIVRFLDEHTVTDIDPVCDMKSYCPKFNSKSIIEKKVSGSACGIWRAVLVKVISNRCYTMWWAAYPEAGYSDIRLLLFSAILGWIIIPMWSLVDIPAIRCGGSAYWKFRVDPF